MAGHLSLISAGGKFHTEGSMKLTLQSLASVILLFALISCRENTSPIVSGKVSFRTHDGIAQDKTLSSEQRRNLSAWLVTNQSGWRMQMATDPIPSVVCEVVHADGTRSSLFLYSQKGWAQVVKLCSSDRKNCIMQLTSEKGYLTLRESMGLEQ